MRTCTDSPEPASQQATQPGSTLAPGTQQEELQAAQGSENRLEADSDGRSAARTLGKGSRELGSPMGTVLRRAKHGVQLPRRRQGQPWAL